MRKLLLLIGLLFITTSYSQKCYSVTEVQNNGEIEGISPKRFTMGVKQITEEILSVNHSICENGKPCLLYTSPSPRDRQKSRMPSSA